MKLKLEIPDKIFGMEGVLLVTFVPVLILAVVMIVSFNLIVVPKISDFQQMNKKITGIDGSKKALDQKRVYLQSIDQSELKKNTEFIGNALLPQNNAYLLLGVVRKITDQNGFQIESFSIRPGELSKEDTAKPAAKINGVAKIPITLTVTGPVNGYLALIKGLENSLPVLSLDTLLMKNLGDVSSMDLQISAYYISDNATFDISKLTLADLTLTSSEANLITRLDQFNVTAETGDLENTVNLKKAFVKFDRVDPFSL